MYLLMLSSLDCSSLIRRMLVGSPEKRATLAEVRLHPWMQMDQKVVRILYNT